VDVEEGNKEDPPMVGPAALCQLCGKSFKCATSIYAHMKRVHGLKGKKCPICDKFFARPSKCAIKSTEKYKGNNKILRGGNENVRTKMLVHRVQHLWCTLVQQNQSKAYKSLITEHHCTQPAQCVHRTPMHAFELLDTFVFARLERNSTN